MSANSKISQLQIRVSPTQKTAIQKAAKAANMDMSKWVLQRLFPPQAKRFQTLTQALTKTKQARYALAELNDFLSTMTRDEFSLAVENKPTAGLSSYYLNYVTAMVEHAAVQKGLSPPPWTETIPALDKPTFGTDLQSLRLYLLSHSPIPFRRRNIFIDATIGDRL